MKLNRYHSQTGAFICVLDVITFKVPNAPLLTSKPVPTLPLEENQYYSLRDEKDQVPYWPSDDCNWVVKTKLEKIIAYHKQTKQPKEFDDKTLVDDEYTIDEPATQFDEFVKTKWVTNKQAKFEHEINAVIARRKSLYADVDALRNEASMIRLIENDEAKATLYEQQAVALYQKIREEHPFINN